MKHRCETGERKRERKKERERMKEIEAATCQEYTDARSISDGSGEGGLSELTA
jgi:hypothetical protein